MSDSNARDGQVPITIKKYANRRLYNTASSSYVTLDHLRQMVQDGVDFVVYDAKSGEDITRSVLTQIIVEEEAKGQNLLPINFLRQLISLYGNSMQWMVPSYLEQMMDGFSRNQDQLRQSMQETFGGIFPFANLEEMSKQQMVSFEQAMRMFTPFAAVPQGRPEEAPKSTPDTKAETTPETSSPDDRQDTLDLLREQVDRLQSQLDALSSGKTKR